MIEGQEKPVKRSSSSSLVSFALKNKDFSMTTVPHVSSWVRHWSSRRRHAGFGQDIEKQGFVFPNDDDDGDDALLCLLSYGDSAPGGAALTHFNFKS